MVVRSFVCGCVGMWVFGCEHDERASDVFRTHCVGVLGNWALVVLEQLWLPAQPGSWMSVCMLAPFAIPRWIFLSFVEYIRNWILEFI